VRIEWLYDTADEVDGSGGGGTAKSSSSSSPLPASTSGVNPILGYHVEMRRHPLPYFEPVPGVTSAVSTVTSEALASVQQVRRFASDTCRAASQPFDPLKRGLCILVL